MAKHFQTSRPGYTKKVYLKLAKRVHSTLKRKGLNPKWNESQKFTSQYLFPQYRDELLSKIDIHDIDNIVSFQLSGTSLSEKIQLPVDEISEECGSVFRVPPGDITMIEWYDIGTAIKIIPDDVKIRVNAGLLYGITAIEKAGDMDYHNSGVAAIVNAIRDDVNNDSGSDYIFEGLTKLVPGRADNGENCNYFIDLILEINGTPVQSPEIEIVGKEKVVELSGQEQEIRVSKKKEAEADKKERRIQAKAERELKKIERQKLEKSKKRARGSAAPKQEEPTQDYAAILDFLYKEYERGLLTVTEYKKQRNKILNKINKS